MDRVRNEEVRRSAVREIKLACIVVQRVFIFLRIRGAREWVSIVWLEEC